MNLEHSPPRDRPPPRRRPYGWSILLLIGHLTSSAIVFVTILTLGWIASWVVGFLDSIHPFPSVIYSLGVRLEIGVFYADVGISSFVLITGMVQLGKDLLENGQ